MCLRPPVALQWLAALMALAVVGTLATVSSASAQAPDPSQPYLLPAPDVPAAPAAGDITDSSARLDDQEAPAEPSPSEPSPSSDPQPAQEPAPSPAGRAAGYPAQPAPAYRSVPPRPRPPAQRPSAGSEVRLPGFSIRLDPLEMLIEGRFGPQLEVDILGFMSVELVPLFFLTDTPIALDLGGFVGRDTEIRQRSHGLGPLVGASLGAGFWLGGRAFEGYVLRVMLTNFGIRYRSEDGNELVDTLTFTERRLQFLFGSMNRFGIFTYGGEFGIGYELNPSDRCDLTDSGPGFGFNARSSGCGELQIAVRDGGAVGDVDLLGPLGRWSLVGRFYVGITID